jgi:hypothetical protein
MNVAMNLFDVYDGHDYAPVRDMVVGPASRSDVNEFAQRWHYTATGGNMTWNYGLWDGYSLVGVVSYNLPPMQTCNAFFGEEHWEWVVHMGRLICAQDAPRNVESKLISGSFALLRKNRPEARLVVTYAATSQGHIGYVYQATNAIYTGTTEIKHFYIDEHGRQRGSKQGTYLSIDKAKARGWTVHQETAKHRYVYLLGSKTERKEALKLLKFPILPYPKPEIVTTKGEQCNN